MGAPPGLPVLVQRTSSVDLHAAMVLYLDTLEAADRTPATIYVYRLFLRKFLTCLEGQTPTNLHVRDYLDGFKAHNTRAQALVVLRQWFKFLRARGVVETDPSKGIPLSKPRRRNYPIVSDDDFTRFLVVLDPEMQVIAAVLYYVGTRITETAAICAEDVSFQEDCGTIDFPRRKGGSAGFAAFGPEVTALLRPWIASRRGRIFSLSVSTVQKRLQKAGEEVGLHGRLTPHRLRHSFICHAIDRGWPQLGLQQQIGHSNPKSTAWYYTPTRAGLVGLVQRFGKSGS